MKSLTFTATFEAECDECLHDIADGDLVGYTEGGMLACRECLDRHYDGMHVVRAQGAEAAEAAEAAEDEWQGGDYYG